MSQTVFERFASHVDRDESGCQLWSAAKFRGGYGMFWHSGRMRSAHRVAYELARGEIPDGMHVCHTCDVRHCVNPAHLFLGTNSENVADKVAKGRLPDMKGVRHPGHKLTEDDVLAIRCDDRSLAVVAAEYGVSKKAVLNIRHRRSWGHL